MKQENKNNIISNENFKVPQDFFDGFLFDMKIKISEDAILSYFGKLNPYKIPEKYFSGITVKLFISENKARNNARILTSRFTKYAAIAATVCLVITISLFYNSHINDTKHESDLLKKNIFLSTENINIEIDNYDDSEIINSITETESIQNIDVSEISGSNYEETIENLDYEYDDISYAQMEEYVSSYVDTETILAEY